MHHDLTSTRNYTYNRAVFFVRSARDGGSGESAVQFSRRLLIVKGAANAAPHIEITKKPHLVISFSKKSFLAIQLCCNH